MAPGGGGQAATAAARLRKDLLRLQRDPVPLVQASPTHANLLEWHYVVRGAPGTPYHGGVYHGKLIFPKEFPFKPPAIYMLTPNGRFQTNMRLCLSISDYHPDTWNPAWTVSTILTGLISFMNEDQQTLGSVKSTDPEKRAYARLSRAYNLKCPQFCELFPTLTEELRGELAAEQTAAQKAAAAQQNAAQKSGNATQNEPQTGANANVNDVMADVGSSWTYNIVLVIGVVALAMAVQYVLTQAYEDATLS